jgi:hypothetical protein
MITSKLQLLTFILLEILAVTNFSGNDTLNDPIFEREGSKHSRSGDQPITIAINELMVDPTPVVGLPDAEWIEIWNYGDLPVNLKEWKLIAGSVSRSLPETKVGPGQYMILCSAQTSAQLTGFGNTLIMTSFPALRNSGNRISLVDETGTTIDIIDYSDTWYKNSLKKNGGWSLERIDPLRSCGQFSNWSASIHPKGGTPGNVNSLFARNIDIEKPSVISALTTSLTTTEVIFSELMDTLSTRIATNYTLSEGMAHPLLSEVTSEGSVRLTWKHAIQINKTYQLHFENITDACGNPLIEKNVEIQWVTVEPGDILLNEILFNPWPSGADFVEIFNASTKKIESGKLMLATWDANHQIKSPVSLKSLASVIQPGGFLAVTADTNGVFPLYLIPDKLNVRQILSLPALNNDKGCIVLLNDSMKVLDQFYYTEDMHHPLLYDVEGVSLERINPFISAGSAGNWQSASSLAGYATPGYQNSQYQAEIVKKTRIVFGQTALSPNSDGYNDQLMIYYETLGTGWVANGHVFDSRGIHVCRMLNNQSLSTEGSITWNGEDESGHRLPIGPYIVTLELFDLNGNREFFKKAVFITERME